MPPKKAVIEDGSPAIKKCNGCGGTFPLSKFPVRHDGKYGVTAQCKKCTSKIRKDWWLAQTPEERKARQRAWSKRKKASSLSSEQHRKYKLKAKYGLTVEEYEEMLQLQSNACAICKSDCYRKLSVDHCHETGRVRGLLCVKCNLGLGCFNDDTKRLKRALEYLE